jgi:hypothetical protein
MSLSAAAREKLRQEFHRKAEEAFQSVFGPDEQEQLITFVQRETRVVERGRELERWLLEKHLASDPLADPSAADQVRCPRCTELGLRDSEEDEPVPRRVVSRAGKQELLRWKYKCPRCRTRFFPLGC